MPQTVQGAVVDAGWGGALLTLPGTAMPAWDQAMRSALWPHLKKAALLRVLVSLKVTFVAAFAPCCPLLRPNDCQYLKRCHQR
jgi:hypothetical protein